MFICTFLKIKSHCAVLMFTGNLPSSYVMEIKWTMN